MLLVAWLDLGWRSELPVPQLRGGRVPHLGMTSSIPQGVLKTCPFENIAPFAFCLKPMKLSVLATMLRKLVEAFLIGGNFLL